MAYGFLLPVAPITGLPCSGHGLCIPPTVHSVQACGSPPIPYSIIIKNLTCWWPPFPLVPVGTLNPLKATVLTNMLPTMTFGDTFINHPSVCTNIVIYLCPCGKGLCPIPTAIPCSVLTIEDMGGVGHLRFDQATSLTVYCTKLPIGRILDPLGIGFPGFSYPCSSVVAYGSPNVLSS
jgi:hypothetical protein